MPRNAIKYKDLWVAQGTKLFEALEKKDTKLAESLYKEQMAGYRAMMNLGWV